MLLGVWQSHDLGEERADEWDRQLIERAHDVADDVSMVLSMRLEEVERMAARAGEVADWGDSERLRVIFDDRAPSVGFLRVYLSDRWGTVMVSSPARGPQGESLTGINYADRPYLRQLNETLEPVIADGLIGRHTRQPIIPIAAPIFTPAHQLRGSVIGAMHVEDLAARLDNNARAGGARIILTDSAGSVMWDSAKRLPALSPYRLAPQGGRGGTATVVTLDDPDSGHAIRRASAPLIAMGRAWRAYVSLPSAQIAARIEEIGGHTLLAAAGTFLLSMSIAYLIALGARSDMRLFSRLQRRIAAGDFTRPSSKVSPMMPREVHEIWNGMIPMLDQVREQWESRQRLIDELQHANERARSLSAGLRDTQDAFMVINRDFRITYVNPAYLRLRDTTLEETLGRQVFDYDPKEAFSPAAVQGIREALAAERPWTGTVVFKHRSDGSPREVDVSISPVFNDQGEVEHYVALSRDVTERREAEQALQQSERLASLGMLAAGVAHEINNPMTYVLGNLEHLSELTAEGLLSVAPAAEVDLALCLEDCLHGARRVVEIVADLRALSQQRQDARTVVASALQTLETCVRMAQSQIRHVAEVVRKFPTEDLLFSINPQRLSQVLLNLIINATHAMSPSNAATNKLTLTVRRRPDGRGEISVRDTGTGMSFEVAQRIFDPFFTTKGTGSGTGLGLSICHSIITAAHGEILVESELGKGTCFRLILPLAPLAEDSVSPQTGSLRGLSVLVVDDEPGVLTAIRRMLVNCRTSTATSVKQALEMIEHDHYDLVLSDVMMAETSGVELVQTLRQRAPALAKKVCLMSGGVIGGELALEVKAIGVPLLHKPMTRLELHEALWQVHSAAA